MACADGGIIINKILNINFKYNFERSDQKDAQEAGFWRRGCNTVAAYGTDGGLFGAGKPRHTLSPCGKAQGTATGTYPPPGVIR